MLIIFGLDLVAADLTGVKGVDKMEDEPKNLKCYTTTEYLLFKLDRTLAVICLGVIASLSIMKGTPQSWQVVGVIAGGLVGYITGRTTSK